MCMYVLHQKVSLLEFKILHYDNHRVSDLYHLQRPLILTFSKVRDSGLTVLGDISVCHLDTMSLLIPIGRKCHFSYSNFLFDLGKVAVGVKMPF